MTEPAAGPSPIAGLFPGYFALVMATGIVSIGTSQQGIDWLAQMLFAVAGIAYVVLVALNVARIGRHGARMFAELTSHAKGFAFLTAVAGTNVLASAAGIVHGWWDLARCLWVASLVLWAVLLYAALIAVVIRDGKPGLQSGINGTWFLLTVSTESIAATGALLLLRWPGDLVAFLCVAAFLLGVALYLIVMTMVFLRWTFHSLDPTEADPPAWIAAGAVAITVLAGSNLLAASASSARIERLAPVIEGFVTLAWATSTFWFPLMLAIGAWRHVARRMPLSYHPSYWAMVFPLGMYGAATYRMIDAIGPARLDWIPPVTFGVALTAWAATFAGLVGSAVRGRSRREGVATTPADPAPTAPAPRGAPR